MAAFNAMIHDVRQLRKRILFAEVQEASGPHMQRATRDVTCCMEKSGGCAQDHSPSGNREAQVLLKSLLTRCDLESARDCLCCRNGPSPPMFLHCLGLFVEHSGREVAEREHDRMFEEATAWKRCLRTPWSHGIDAKRL